MAGANTLGVQLILFSQANNLASVLWYGALLVWLICIGFIVFNALMSQEKVTDSISGAMLLLTVSTVLIVLPGSYLLDAMDGYIWCYVVLWGMWILGCILYLYIIYLIIRRLLPDCFVPENWQPAYWICMGAFAIITLAGSEFLAHLPHSLYDDLGQMTLTISLLA